MGGDHHQNNYLLLKGVARCGIVVDQGTLKGKSCTRVCCGGFKVSPRATGKVSNIEQQRSVLDIIVSKQETP